ncbi:MAG TPA: tetratricopeptide repeat protein [Terriglobales bacterium]|nr:tetratricopeptide repeat protein [Terriglobales bacterium]
MKPYGSSRFRRLFFRTVLILAFTLLTTLAVASHPKAENSKPKPAQQILKYHLQDEHTRRGFEHFYNLQYDKAIKEFETALEKNPDDAFAVNHLLSGVMFKEMYRIGALDSELYAKEGFLQSKQFPVEQKTKDRIKALMQQSLQLSDAKLKTNPNDVDALYARGVTRGLKSTYTALIEKAWFSALRSAVGARHDHEKVLELAPDYTDAKMIVGMHNYVIGSVSWAVKVAASIIGLSGSREKGIKYLYEAANGGGEAAVDAKIALALFLRREERYKEAIELIDGLNNSYPHNFLMALELANLYNASGKAPEAIASYHKLLKAAESGAYPEAHIEMAWYGLGEALRGQRDAKNAAEAFERVLQFQKTDPDLRLRASLGAGEMCDVLQRREDAVKHYQTVVAEDPDSPRASLAKKHLKQPYRMM